MGTPNTPTESEAGGVKPSCLWSPVHRRGHTASGLAPTGRKAAIVSLLNLKGNCGFLEELFGKILRSSGRLRVSVW